MRHTTQRLSCVLQNGVGDWQSPFPVHWTHSLVVVLQMGAVAEHCELLVQPERHVKSCGSQIGCAEPQSEFARHSTHRPARRKQRGADAGQSPFDMHETHWPSDVLQIGESAGQSVFCLHSTHEPLLQTGMSGGHAVVGHVP